MILKGFKINFELNVGLVFKNFMICWESIFKRCLKEFMLFCFFWDYYKL